MALCHQEYHLISITFPVCCSHLCSNVRIAANLERVLCLSMQEEEEGEFPFRCLVSGELRFIDQVVQ